MVADASEMLSKVLAILCVGSTQRGQHKVTKGARYGAESAKPLLYWMVARGAHGDEHVEEQHCRERHVDGGDHPCSNR